MDLAKRMEIAVVNRKVEHTGGHFVFTMQFERDWRLQGSGWRVCGQIAMDGSV